jgi:hypothetical protein
MSKKYLEKVDLDNFWEISEYAVENYTEDELTSDIIDYVQSELGYKLPDSYIALMKTCNGGIPNKTCFPTNSATSWAEDHVAITGISGIGKNKTYSLCGDLGSQFMIDEWEYPKIGVVICDCPSAGHDVIMLDYRKCGIDGEPEVVHVDQSYDYKITFLAKNFEDFINGLIDEEQFN